MLKICLITLLLLYVGILAIWCYRFPISNKLTTGSYYELVVDHDFTEAEREDVKKAYDIRQTISNLLLYSSIVLSVGSYIALRNHWFEPRAIVKAALYISGAIAVILILVNGIHFIPGPPIR